MSQLEGAVPSAAGILFVLSTVLDPDRLAPAAFADWYENTHIQEVQSTGGIAASARYEALTFTEAYRGRTFGSSGPVPKNRRLEFDFVTVYEMPDLQFRESAAFRGLNGQSAPREELLEGLFRRVSFITRFAEETSSSGSAGKGEGSGPAPFAVTLAGAGIPLRLDDVEGVRRVRGLKVHEGSLLERFERSWLEEPREMVILEVESEEVVAAVAERVGEAEGLEVGFWGLRRAYDGSERTPRAWSVPKKS